MALRLLLPSFILLLTASRLSAADAILLSAEQKFYRVAAHCEYLLDTLGITANELRNAPFSDSFSPGYYSSDGHIWVRLTVKNISPWEDFILTVDQWSAARLMYQEANGRWHTLQSGTSVPVDSRPESLHRLISFPIELDSAESRTLYLQLSNKEPLRKNYARLYDFLQKIELEEASLSRSKFIGNQLVIVFIMGIAFILFIYNLGIFIYVRNSAFAFLALYLLAAALFIANIHGITTNYLLRWTQSYEFVFGLVLYHVLAILNILFIKSYLGVKRGDWLNWLALALALFMLLSLGVSLAQQQSFWYFPRRLFEMAVLLTVLVVSIYRKKEGARLLFFAVLTVLAGNFYSDFMAVANQPDLFVYSDMAYLSGLLVQFCLFSLGSSYKFYRLNARVVKSETEKRQILENQNAVLNNLVEERTALLQDALANLSQKNEELLTTQTRITQQNEDIEIRNRELNEVNLALLSKNIEIEKQARQLNKAYKKINELNESLEEEVRLRTEKLRQALTELDTFLYRSSHDMRRPLTTIQGLLHLIEKERDKEQVAQLTAKALNTIKGIDRMLEKLITVHQSFEKAKDISCLNLYETFLSVFEQAKETFPNYRFQYAINVSKDLSIKSSTALFFAVIKYCIENAIIFCREDFVKITISSEVKEENLVIHIADDGLGIEKDIRDQIFNMFFRGHAVSVGNGLGLYVVRKCMEAMNGTVLIQSEEQVGTTVSLYFPADKLSVGEASLSA